MSSPELVTVMSGSPLYQTLLAAGGWDKPTLSGPLLRQMGDSTRGMETNTLRMPIWAPVKTVQLALLPETDLGPFYGSEYVVKGCARMNDFRLLVELVDAYVRLDCPEHRRVPFTLGGAAQALGYRSGGGRQRDRVKDALDRLGSVRIRRTLVRFGAKGSRQEDTLGYPLIGLYQTTSRGGGRGWVELSEPIAILARLGELTYLHKPLLDRLLAEDEVAARLWSYLEADDGPERKTWRYSLFAKDLTGLSRQRDMPALSDMLWLKAERRRNTVARIRKACKTIERRDPRYSLKVAASPGPGMWRLEASRERYVDVTPIATDDVTPKGTLTCHPDPETRAQPSVDPDDLLSCPTVESLLKNSERVVTPSGDSEDTNPILLVLRTKGWRKPSMKMVDKLLETAGGRLGDDASFAEILQNEYPGRAKMDVFDWTRSHPGLRLSSRPFRGISLDEPPPGQCMICGGFTKLSRLTKIGGDYFCSDPSTGCLEDAPQAPAA